MAQQKDIKFLYCLATISGTIRFIKGHITELHESYGYRQKHISHARNYGIWIAHA